MGQVDDAPPRYMDIMGQVDETHLRGPREVFDPTHVRSNKWSLASVKAIVDLDGREKGRPVPSCLSPT